MSNTIPTFFSPFQRKNQMLGNSAIFGNPKPFFMNPVFWICAFFVIDGILVLRIIPKVGTGVCFLGFLMTAFSQPNALRVFKSPVMLWAGIAYTLLYFAFARFIEYGPYRGYSTGLILYRLLRVLPILLMGMYLANSRRGVFWAILTVLGVNGIMSFFMVRYGLQFAGETGQAAARIMHSEGMTLDAAIAGVAGVHQAAARAYIFILAAGLFLSVRNRMNLSGNIVYLGLLGMLGLGILFSGFTAPILLIVIACGLIAAFQFFKIRTFVFSIFMLGLLVGGYMFAQALQINAILFPFEKAISLLSIPFGGGAEETRLVDVDRYRLFMVSFRTFLDNPLTGVGGYLFIPGIGLSTDTPIGGHSTFGDWLAQFGLIGNFGLFIIGISIYKNLRHIRLSGRARAMGPFAIILKVYFLVWLIHSLGNPVLAAANIDVMTAFAMGLVHGFSRTPGLFAATAPPAFLCKPSRM